jgi:hypothetical protein
MNKWSEISALGLEISGGTDGFNFEKLQIANLVSMNPEVALFNGWSWEMGANIWSFKDVKTWRRQGLAAGANLGLGKSYVVGDDGDLTYVFATSDINTKYQSVGLKWGLAQYLTDAKNNLEVFANAATRGFGSIGISDNFTFFINRNRQVDTSLKLEYYYWLSKFGSAAAVRLTQHF